MFWIISIILSITTTLYFFLREKTKGHDFRLVNKVRPYMQLLLFSSIVLALPCIAYVLYIIISHFTDNNNVLSIIIGLTISVMIVFIANVPLKVNNSTPSENAFAIYLRSFRSDSIYGNNIENLVRSLIQCLYPIYEIGNPYEVIKIYKKNITIYSTDEDWQEKISELKSKAKIIIIKLDGTEGLGWEINSVKKDLKKVLFVASDEDSFNDFSSLLVNKDIQEYHGFPTPSTFPSLIWKNSDSWYCGDHDSLRYYISQHPWQEESIDWLINSLVSYSIYGTKTKYLVHRFPTFLKGNKSIAANTPFKLKIAFLLFPFSQQFWWNIYISNSSLSWIINLYLYGSAGAYYMFLFLFPYNIQHGLDGNNLGLRIAINSFICMVPIYVLSYLNGDKALWIGNSFLTEKNFQRLIKKNFIKGLIFSLLALGGGIYSKYSMEVEKAKEKAFFEKINPGYEQRKEITFCRSHIDSIFIDVSTNYAIVNFDKYGEIDKVVEMLGDMESAFHQAIEDSIGSSCYYPTNRDSLKTDSWYKDIAWKVIYSFEKDILMKQ